MYERPQDMTPLVEDARQRFGGDSWDITGGQFSSVAIIHGAASSYIVKTSLSLDVESAYDQALTEHMAIEHIDQKRSDCPVDIPQPLGIVSHEENGAWPYMAATYVPGESLDSEHSDKPFTSEERMQIGIKMGEIMLWMQTLDIDTFRPPRREPPSYPWENWDDWFAIFAQFDDRCFPTLCRAAATTQKQYQALYPNGMLAAAGQLIHGDLNRFNLLSTPGSREVTGAIDFAFMRAGDTAQEGRLFTTPFLGSEALSGCNAVLRHHGIPTLTMEQTDFWLKGPILSIALHHAQNKSAFTSFYIHSIEEVLRRWYPEEDWDRFYREYSAE